MKNQQNINEIKTNSLFPQDQEMGFTLYNLEDVLGNNREVTAQPQRNDFYQVAWVSSGNGITVVDGKNYHYGPNTVFIVQPGQVMYIAHDEGTCGTSICFNESFLMDDTHKENLLLKYNILDAAYAQPFYQLSSVAAPIIRDLIEDIRTESVQPPSAFGHRRALQYLFQLILIIVQRSIPNFVGLTMDITNPNHALYIRFRHLLEEHFKDGWSVWQYAESLAVSEKALASAVRTTANSTPAAIVKERVLTEACRLLQYSDQSIFSIALALGGMDQSNFNKFFRTGTGFTPAEYRKRMQAQS